MNWKSFISFCIKHPFSLPKTIWFNFHYLPFRQAMKMPIFCYKIRLRKTKGEVIIDSENIKTGMIQLGNDIVGIYPNNGLCWENQGKVIFRGITKFGNNCSVCIGRRGTLDLGNNFITNAATKNNWLGTKCTVFPGAKTPDYCVVGAGSFVNKDISDWPTRIMVAGNPVQIKVRDVWRDTEDDKPEIGF